MKILIIGGTGVISSSITLEALRKGINVFMINRGNRTIPKGVSLIKSDKNDYTFIKSQLIGLQFDAIIDFLCYTQKDAEESFSFYSKFTTQYFFISSCAVYDKTIPGLKYEDSPKGLKIWKYSTNKWSCEQAIQNIAKTCNCNYTVVRPCITYDDTRIPYGIMPTYGYHWTLCARILAGKPIIRWNKGSCRSNMMRVEDFSIGFVGLIGNPKSKNQAFNICGDEMPSFNDVLETIQDILQKKAIIVDIPSEFYAKEIPVRAGEILGGRSIDALNSNEKIKQVVPDFKQTITLKEGIKKTIKAYKEQNYQKGIDWIFDAETDAIILKFCKLNHIDPIQYNLGFVDYLENATKKDKNLYLLNFYKNRFGIRYFIKGFNFLKRVLKFLQKK